MMHLLITVSPFSSIVIFCVDQVQPSHITYTNLKPNGIDCLFLIPVMALLGTHIELMCDPRLHNNYWFGVLIGCIKAQVQAWGMCVDAYSFWSETVNHASSYVNKYNIPKKKKKLTAFWMKNANDWVSIGTWISIRPRSKTCAAAFYSIFLTEDKRKLLECQKVQKKSMQKRAFS